MTLTDFKDKLSFYVPPSELATITHVVVSGKGSFYQDADGKNFLDFTSGIFTNTFGHGDEEIKQTLAKVFGSLGNIHGRQWIGAPDFYRRLFRFLPSKDYRVVAYGDGGGYTVDRCLTELFYHFGKKTFNLMTLAGGFHGKTIGNKFAVNPNESCSFFHTHISAPPYCYRCPFGKERTTCRLECATKLEEQLLQTQAQVFMFEPVLGGAVYRVLATNCKILSRSLSHFGCRRSFGRRRTCRNFFGKHALRHNTRRDILDQRFGKRFTAFGDAFEERADR